MRRRCASIGGISAEHEKIFCALGHFVGGGIFVATVRCAIHHGVVVGVVVRTWRRRKRQGLFRTI
jgi:uncharacterized membrane protein YczE